MDFADTVYDASEGWPGHEHFALRSQVRRAVFSIPANVAEGQARSGEKEYLHHLSIAYGSLNETETALQFAHRRKYIDAPTLDVLMDQSGEVGRLLLGLMCSLRDRLGQ
jgi:four helix bundle protein